MATSTFEFLPAIDLRGGRVVRLRRGDFGAETTYGADPVAVARSFAATGARWLHVVDLDGARDGRRQQAAVMASIVEAVGEEGVAVQVAGGLRTLDAVASALATGARRVVVGTAAIRDAGFGRRSVERFGADRIVAAIDVRAGRALGDAWQAGSHDPGAEEAVAALADAGVERFAVTAVDRDGILEGPNLELLGRIVRLDRGAIIASGGVSSLADLRSVRDLGCAGAIVGRALYEGRLDVRDALAAVAG